MNKRTATMDGTRVVAFRMEGFGMVKTTVGAMEEAMAMPKRQLAKNMAEACTPMHGQREDTTLVGWWMAHPKSVVAIVWAGTGIEALL